MAEVFAPFIINRTIGKLTFYQMEGRNFVRKKSSLTRRKVLYSPQFERTRHYAGLMAKASRIGSHIYNALPAYWRQGWMYRSFTGEALRLLKAGKKEPEIQQLLKQQYVEAVVNKQTETAIVVPLPVPQKRAYRKLNNAYWQGKTIKSVRRKANSQRLLYNAALLARASKIGAKLYAHISSQYKCRSYFQQLTAWAMQLLKEEIDEADIIAMLLPTDPPEKYQQPPAKKMAAGLVVHPNGQYHFIPSWKKHFDAAAIIALPIVCHCSTPVKLLNKGRSVFYKA
jgi:hypothetical protein